MAAKEKKGMERFWIDDSPDRVEAGIGEIESIPHERKNLCPIMSRPYLHKFNSNGYEEGETRMHEISCYGEDCQLWDKGRKKCGLKVK